jgi:hypothetical protein
VATCPPKSQSPDITEPIRMVQLLSIRIQKNIQNPESETFVDILEDIFGVIYRQFKHQHVLTIKFLLQSPITQLKKAWNVLIF